MANKINYTNRNNIVYNKKFYKYCIIIKNIRVKEEKYLYILL